jgi:hypothetical protein
MLKLVAAFYMVGYREPKELTVDHLMGPPKRKQRFYFGAYAVSSFD